MTTLDKDIETDELNAVALEHGYCYRIFPPENGCYTWQVHRPGDHKVSGVEFSLEEVIEKVKAAITDLSPVYCNHCNRNDNIRRTVKTSERWDEKKREWIEDEHWRELRYQCGNCDAESVTDEA
jgi:hypothetical protein